MKAVDKHSKIIIAATKVFAKKGFFNARISDIAKEAKVADGTIYLYFNNKIDILVSVFEKEIGTLVTQTIKLLDAEPDPGKQLEIFVIKHLTAMKKNKNLAEVIQIELRQTDKLIKNYRNTKFNDYLNIISDIIKEGQKQKIFRQDIIPDVAKRIIFGGLDELSRVWNLSLETNYSVEDVGFQIVRILLSGITAPEAEKKSSSP